MAHITPSTDNDDNDAFGDAPIPNPALDTLRQQLNAISLAWLTAIPSSLLSLGFAWYGGTISSIGAGVLLLVLLTFTVTVIIFKILFVIRGGTLTPANVIGLLVQILVLLLALGICFHILILAIKS